MNLMLAPLVIFLSLVASAQAWSKEIQWRKKTEFKPLEYIVDFERAYEFKVSPGLTHEEVEGAMSKNTQSINNCWKKRAATREMEFVAIRMIVDENGNVTESRIDGDSEAARINACMLEIVDAVVFPRPKKGREVRINYPIVFPYEASSALKAATTMKERTKGRAIVSDCMFDDIPKELDERNVWSTLYDNRKRLQKCLKLESPKWQKDDHSRAAVEFFVDPKGKVKDLKIKIDPFNSKAATDCVIEIMSAYEFAPPKSGKSEKVYHPWFFPID